MMCYDGSPRLLPVFVYLFLPDYFAALSGFKINKAVYLSLITVNSLIYFLQALILLIFNRSDFLFLFFTALAALYGTDPSFRDLVLGGQDIIRIAAGQKMSVWQGHPPAAGLFTL